MLENLRTENKVVGTKQVQKSIEDGKAKKVFVAKDADEEVTGDIKTMCQKRSIDLIYVETMVELGDACGIDVSAATAALLR